VESFPHSFKKFYINIKKMLFPIYPHSILWENKKDKPDTLNVLRKEVNL